MNSSFASGLALLGRILLALMFVLAGYGKVTGFAGTSAYIASKGLPLPALLTVGAIAVELGAGLLLVAGFKTRWAAFALAAFTLVASLIFHAYWTLPAGQQMTQQLMFLKNVAVIGGLLTVCAFGAGRYSLDRR